MRHSQMIVALGIALGATAASADFVPGRFYAPRFPIDGSGGSHGIWEFDPLTGQSRLFADTEPFDRFVSGLTFTPDGRELRASVVPSSTIVGFDSDGVGQVVLDSSDGIGYPFGSNNLTYDQFGNFFIVNYAPPQILRFPPDGGPGSVFATTPTFGSIAPAPDGSLYLSSTALFHVLTFGALVQIDDEVAGSVATTRNGDLFVLDIRNGVYRFPQGNPDAREFLVPAPYASFAATLAVSPDELSLLVNTDFGDFYSIDIGTGTTSLLGGFPNDGLFGGYGFAVSVPEPSTVLLILLIGAIHATRNWLHPRSRRENRRDGGNGLPRGGRRPNAD